MHINLIGNSDLENVYVKIGKIMKQHNRPVLVALDGRSGTGKSTIAKKIVDHFGGVEIVSDDFWVGGSNEVWDKRSPKEKSEMAIDWKRIRSDVLEPLLAGKPAFWHPFDWSVGKGLSTNTIQKNPAHLIVLDGAYSTRPELLDLIDLSVLIEVPNDAKRRARLVERENKEYMDDWHSRWDVAEDYYFSEVRPKESFDMVIQNY